MAKTGFDRRGTGRRTGPDAEALAIEALGFLAADTARLERFLSVSGLAPETLRRAAASPGFLAAVLDYVVADEPLLLAFAHAAGVDPASVATAHATITAREAST